ncbi:hypothetical protein KP509_27G070200 [Ceratopteris richardii]|uniref:Uncharacterized protein n=1 Tax=Ceratopteris richardii TaxID=49495 RepID=A0A8T2RJM0_CERRI|nr:hypothetical protein KP509_27G070200 [Ceratopteris richardii]
MYRFRGGGCSRESTSKLIGRKGKKTLGFRGGMYASFCKRRGVCLWPTEERDEVLRSMSLCICGKFSLKRGQLLRLQGHQVHRPRREEGSLKGVYRRS